MLVADDFLLEASGPCCREALVVFFLLCSSCKVPLSWNKTAGGDTVTWVGFELLLVSSQLGISARRAEWLVRWAREVANSTHIQMSRFEEGLGRIENVAGAWNLSDHFLALCTDHAWVDDTGLHMWILCFGLGIMVWMVLITRGSTTRLVSVGYVLSSEN